MQFKKKFLYPIGLLSVMAVFFSFTHNDKLFQIAKNMEIFANIIQKINKNYVEDINPAEVIEDGISAMLNKLDPYTNYIPEDKIENLRTTTNGIYAGIGIVIQNSKGHAIVFSVEKDYPAYRAGVEIGDTIVSINKIALTSDNMVELVELIKGQVNSHVDLKLHRYGSAIPIEKQINRENIHITNVPFSQLIAEDIGVIKLIEFSRDASKEVINALQVLKSKGAKKIIIDLRNNPGGLLIEAIKTVNIFIPKDKKVVEIRGKLKKHSATHNTFLDPIDIQIPLVILINKESASAAEILAGVVQDYDRGVVIGERSFGKGLVQQTFSLKYNAQLKVTIAKYYTPSGRCIQEIEYNKNKIEKKDMPLETFYTKNKREVFGGNGIFPDIKVEKKRLSAITYELLKNYIFFDYATKYKFSHQELRDSTHFQINNKELEDFLKQIPDSLFENNYNTILTHIEKLENYFTSKKNYELEEEKIKELQTLLEKKKKNLLLSQENREEIRQVLQQEIIRHYYLSQEAFLTSLHKDPFIQKAIDILKNKEEYDSLLSF